MTIVRAAEPRDLDAIADFEVTIAEISFGEDAITDPGVHRRKIEKAMQKDPAGMLVAVDDHDVVVGWLWISINKNFLTGATYANFRSLAVSTNSGGVGEALLDRGLAFARDAGVTEVVGKVHVGNAPMRVLYRKLGFEAQHLTMRLRTR